MYAICGATGNIGRAIAEKLLAQGKKVRAIGRSAEKLRALADKGAEPVVADLLDTDAIANAFEGVEAVYAMIPPDMATTDFRGYQNKIGKSLVDAIKRARVKYVVNLSSVGANNPDGMGVVNGLYDQEQRLNQLEDTNVIHLRPTFFMENHLWQVETIKQHGLMATPQDPDAPLAQIATSDIADYSIARMTKLDFEGKVSRDLLGPADISMNDVAAAIGQAIGKKDLKYTRVSFDDSRKHMIGMGISEDVADGLIDLDRAISDGSLRPTETRSLENSTPTTVDDFSEIFAQFYKN